MTNDNYLSLRVDKMPKDYRVIETSLLHIRIESRLTNLCYDFNHGRLTNKVTIRTLDTLEAVDTYTWENTEMAFRGRVLLDWVVQREAK